MGEQVLQRQGQCDTQPAPVTVGQADASTVCFHNLTHESEAEPRAPTLGRVERQQSLSQNRLAHAETPITHIYPLLLSNMGYHQLDCLG